MEISYKVRSRKCKGWRLKSEFWNLFFLFFVAGMCSFTCSSTMAQGVKNLPKITLEEAVDRAISNFPKIKAARLAIEQQEVLKKTAWDLGNTQIFTGGEELKGTNEGVYTVIGIQQQNMNIFGIAPSQGVQKQKVALAEAALNLDELALKQQVKQAYVEAYIVKKNLELYRQLDSIYLDFERAARIRFEVEETSKLEYLAATNQVKQISLQKTQAEYDYSTALSKLNLWLVSDTLYTVASSDGEEWVQPLKVKDSVVGHPLLQMAAQQMKVADAERKVAVANFLPKLNGQYGLQNVAGESGYYQYQVGISIPLFFLPQQGQAQSAAIQQQIAAEEYTQTQLELQANFQSLLQQYQKWLASWQFYEDEALPLAREQREGTILAYKEGAINYVTFIQNLKEAVQIEVKAQEAFHQYLDFRFQLEYYLNSSDQK